jgi:hypothetical protein
MSDMVVHESEWMRLASELNDIHANEWKITWFMKRHANKKLSVRSVCVGLFSKFSVMLLVLQINGAPVWLCSAAMCEKNVLQWLAHNAIKPPAVDSWVRCCDDLAA